MSDKTDVVSIRLPEDLLRKIDEINNALGFCKTRAEYVAKSMDTLFRAMISSKLTIDQQIEQLKGIQEIDSSFIIQLTKAVMDRYVQKYEKYSMDKQQVLVRVPPKLLENIEKYRIPIGLYTDRSEFIRLAVSNQVENDTIFIESMERVMNHTIIKTKSADEFIASVLKKLAEPGSEGLDTMVSLVNLFVKEAGAQKKE